MKDIIPYSRHQILDEDIEAVVGVLKSGQLTQGNKVEEYEQAICDKLGCLYAVAVNSGTSALIAAIAALDLPKGSKILIADNTYIAQINAILINGHIPIVSCYLNKYGCLSEEFNERIFDLEKDIRCVIYTNFSGYSNNVKEVSNLCAKYNCFLIEDSAHALGSKYNDDHYVGSCLYSDITTFSTHATKNIVTGEGGFITVNDNLYNRRLRYIRLNGISYRDDNWYYQSNIGYNFKLTDFQAALGLSQLKRLDTITATRQGIARKYIEGLQGKGISRYFSINEYDECCNYHLFPLFANSYIFDELESLMRKKSIHVGRHYKELELHPIIGKYKIKIYQQDTTSSGCIYQIGRGFDTMVLPMFNDITNEQIQYICDSLEECLEEL